MEVTNNERKIKIAVIGCGRFSPNFIPLFKAHPFVEKVYVCDEKRERAENSSERFDVDIIDSFEQALESDEINSIAIFTQRFKHGKMVIAALKAGKHVYSAVPCSLSVDEIIEIEKFVRETRLTYSMGETGYYRATAIFCRREFAKGTFGKFTYAEAHYNHDNTIYFNDLTKEFCLETIRFDLLHLQLLEVNDPYTEELQRRYAILKQA